jgi:hypothetical protein
MFGLSNEPSLTIIFFSSANCTISNISDFISSVNPRRHKEKYLEPTFTKEVETGIYASIFSSANKAPPHETLPELIK